MTTATNPWRSHWLATCLFFTAALLFTVASAVGNDPTRLMLVAGLLNWLCAFVHLFRLRAALADAPAAAASSSAARS